MEVKEIIFCRRRELGLTLEEIAVKVGVSKSTVKKWETGYIKNMRCDKMLLLADALKISPLDLLGGNSANNADGYYDNSKMITRIEALRTDPARRILFDATQNLSKDDVIIILNLINGLKSKEGKK